MRGLVWFRSDLRVRDNTALFEACKATNDGVIAVFLIHAEQWKDHDWAPIKVDFLLRNLLALQESLRQLEIPLLVREAPRFSQAPSHLLEIANEHDCDSLWFNREYEINERRRDQSVVEAFEQTGKTTHAFTDQVILPPESIQTSEGNFYSVFTPYKKNWVKSVALGEKISCRPRPRKQKPLSIRPSEVPTEVKGHGGNSRPDLWKSGEEFAHRSLKKFVAQRLSNYHASRDLPAQNGTSTLSPYLAIGVLSPRQCLRAALDANDERFDWGDEGASIWISELIWREFYRHVLVGFPRLCRNEPFRKATDQVRWRNSDSDFASWKEGRTGIPIVDAAMHQLQQTGWMHNRLRMVVAMFLTKNLLIDWRRGEQFFMRNLVDGDFASNSGGWQWAASVGTDAAPYFRIFNPVTQSERFDAQGTFIRKFLPELSPIEGKAIHSPHERAPLAMRKIDYPTPIVDLKSSRLRAIDEFKLATTPFT